MKRVLNSKLPAVGRPVLLAPDEAQHITRVLRLGEGATVEVIDGQGHAVIAVLRMRGNGVYLELEAKALAKGTATRAAATDEIVPVTLELAILKGDAMEWAVEKCVELGVQSLVPLITAHTVVQTGRKTPEDFQNRWQRIADQALKQCGRLSKMEVHVPMRLEERIASALPNEAQPRLWCDEATRAEQLYLGSWLEQATQPATLTLLVGPEGGWSEIERSLLQTASIPISLGPVVLRAETAALFSASLATAWFRC